MRSRSRYCGMRIPGSSVPSIAAAGVVLSLLDAVIASTLSSSRGRSAWCRPSATPSLPSPSLLTGHPFVVGCSAVAIAVAVRARGRPARTSRASHLARVWSRGRQSSARRRATCARLPCASSPAGPAASGSPSALLAAFGLTATLPLATVVVLAGGLSTLVPTPGGAGTQQVLLVYALRQTATAASALSFSVGMQFGITTVNTLVGLIALMILFRTLRPRAALRAIRAPRTGA